MEVTHSVERNSILLGIPFEEGQEPYGSHTHLVERNSIEANQNHKHTKSRHHKTIFEAIYKILKLSTGGQTGSCVDVMYCVMLKNISHERNGCCRKMTEEIDEDR